MIFDTYVGELMSVDKLKVVIICACVFAIVGFVLSFKRISGVSRVAKLIHSDNEFSFGRGEINWKETGRIVERLSDALGRAGFQTRKQRFFAKVSILIFFIVPLLLTFLMYSDEQQASRRLVVIGISLYVSYFSSVVFIKFRRKQYVRKVSFELPLVIEALVLLVESGLSIIPAIQQLVSRDKEGSEANPVLRIFRLAYELTANGMPFQQALELVSNNIDIHAFKHVLLHLDISAVEGGELVPSLRNLSDHCHQEWKLSVETRVRRLENLVVFPVFVSVIGLVILVSAVPIVPLKGLAESVQSGNLKNIDRIDNVKLKKVVKH